MAIFWRHFTFALLVAIFALLPSGSGSIADHHTGITVNKTNITVQADSELEWRRDTRQYFARGNALITTPQLALRAAIITANTSLTDSKSNDTANENISIGIGSGRITSISGTGNASITYENGTGSADRITFVRDDNTLWLTGGEVRITRGNNTITAHRSIAYDRDQGIITAIGEVQVLFADGRRFSGDRVDAYLARDQQRITHIALAGNVTLFDGENVLTGEAANIDLAQGSAQILAGKRARVRGQFIP